MQQFEFKIFFTEYGEELESGRELNPFKKIVPLQSGSYTFEICNSKGKYIAALRADIFEENGTKKAKILYSAENLEKTLPFYRQIRQTPFRLIEFAFFTLLKKSRINCFDAHAGEHDKGIGHERQQQEELFRQHPNGRKISHELGNFPEVSTKELALIVSGKKPMQERLLPPFSSKRNTRALTYSNLPKQAGIFRKLWKKILP